MIHEVIRASVFAGGWLGSSRCFIGQGCSLFRECESLLCGLSVA